MKLVKLLTVISLAITSFVFADGELVIVRPSDPVSLDANLETTAPGAWVFGNIIEPLITLNANMEIEPRLATDWEFISPERLRLPCGKG